MYLLGTDEAGYGPNLGPLVVSATLWRLPEAQAAGDLYDLLGAAISPDPVARADHRLPIADSKRLYTSGSSWEQLELGLLAAVGALGGDYLSARGLWRTLAPQSLAALADEPWSAEWDGATPQAADPARIAALADRLATALTATGIDLLAIAARPVFPREFNALVERQQNKSAVLSHATLELARGLLQAHAPDEPVVVHGDKHGGRDRYAALLQHFFPEERIEIVAEGRARSIYRFGPPARRVEFRFVAKGDHFPPAALASMASKYLRELAMAGFNQFWRRQLPDLRPTAGYPQDAARFQREIAAAQEALGIETADLWRCR